MFDSFVPDWIDPEIAETIKIWRDQEIRPLAIMETLEPGYQSLACRPPTWSMVADTCQQLWADLVDLEG